MRVRALRLDWVRWTCGCADAARLQERPDDRQRPQLMATVGGLVEFSRNGAVPAQRAVPFDTVVSELAQRAFWQFGLDQRQHGVRPCTRRHQLLDASSRGTAKGRMASASLNDCIEYWIAHDPRRALRPSGTVVSFELGQHGTSSIIDEACP